MTPSLAAALYLLSACPSRGTHGPGDHRMLLLDIRKAFLYGKISRNVYGKLLSENQDERCFCGLAGASS